MNEDKRRSIPEILNETKVIAVVGLSANPHRPSYRVAQYLKDHDYKIIPVNPKEEMILGEKSYPDLLSIPEPVDVVDVFRAPEYVPEVAEQAVKIKAKALWLQEGVTSAEGERIAREAGLDFVQDMCIKIAHATNRGS